MLSLTTDVKYLIDWYSEWRTGLCDRPATQAGIDAFNTIASVYGYR